MAAPRSTGLIPAGALKDMRKRDPRLSPDEAKSKKPLQLIKYTPIILDKSSSVCRISYKRCGRRRTGK